jgi:hypothetical protein
VCAGADGLFGDEYLLPAGHPQNMSVGDFNNKLGGAAPTTPAEGALRAMKDNIVLVGTEK